VLQGWAKLSAKQRVAYKLRVHTVPEDLRLPLAPNRAHLADASAAYRLAVESRLLWDVWMIDDYGELWIAVSFENERDEPEFHTLRIDAGTYRKVPCDPYEPLVEPRRADARSVTSEDL
jgi:hypothetical protein